MKKLRYGLGLVALVLNGSVAQMPTQSSAKTVIWEFTYLRSLPGQHERLAQFIRQNWFAMDSVATQRGLMNEYKLLDAGTDAPGDWNLLVAVAYPQEKGYEGIQAEFEAIRRQHVKRLIDGLDLPRLGRIVTAQKLYERTGMRPGVKPTPGKP